MMPPIGMANLARSSFWKSRLVATQKEGRHICRPTSLDQGVFPTPKCASCLTPCPFLRERFSSAPCRKIKLITDHQMLKEETTGIFMSYCST